MSAPNRDTHWRAVRDAIAYGVMCTDHTWNGDTWADADAPPISGRLDALTDQYIEQTPETPGTRLSRESVERHQAEVRQRDR